MSETQATTFTVRVMVLGAPKEALHALQDLLDNAFENTVCTYTTETYQSADGEEIDTELLMR
jgi:hypothetical protein